MLQDTIEEEEVNRACRVRPLLHSLEGTQEEGFVILSDSDHNAITYDLRGTLAPSVHPGNPWESAEDVLSHYMSLPDRIKLMTICLASDEELADSSPGEALLEFLLERVLIVGCVHYGHVWLASISVMLSAGFPPSTAWIESNEFERFRTLAIDEYSSHLTRVLAGVDDVSNERTIGA